MILSPLLLTGGTVITYDKPLGMAKVKQVCDWLDTYVGIEDEEWSWVSYTIAIRFKKPEDASVFALKFGLR